MDIREKAFCNWVASTAENPEEIVAVLKSIGIKVIDDEHKRFTGYVVELNKQILEYEENSLSLGLLNKQKNLLGKIYSYAKQHFESEQKITEKFSLACDAIQKKEHNFYLKKIKSFIDDFDKGIVCVDVDFKRFLLNWFINHINNDDFNAYSLREWKKHILEAKTLDDIDILYKTSDIAKIDILTKDLLEFSIARLFKLQSENKEAVIDTLLQIENKFIDIVKSILSICDEYKIIYKNNFKAAYNDILLKIGILKKLNDKNDIKVKLVSELINFVSRITYDSVCADEHMDDILLNSNSISEINSFIKKTNISNIDDEHYHFVEMVVEDNLMISELPKEKQLEALKSTIDKLFEYAETHFAHEEEIMGRNPEFKYVEEHKLEHQNLIKTMKDLAFFIIEGNSEITTILRSKLLNIWINHTNTTDQLTFNSDNN